MAADAEKHPTVNGVQAPKLQELLTRQCSPEELQAALVHMIQLHNGLVTDINNMVRDGRIRSSHEATMSRPYTL